MMLNELAKRLVEVCRDEGLEYDPRVLPIKLTADCYIIYATPIDDDCKSNGKCQVKQYYALTGKTIKIEEGASWQTGTWPLDFWIRILYIISNQSTLSMIFTEYHQKAINLLADAYSKDFANYVSKNETFMELLHELSEKYIDQNIPIVDVDATYELALSLCERVTVE